MFVFNELKINENKVCFEEVSFLDVVCVVFD